VLLCGKKTRPDISNYIEAFEALLKNNRLYWISSVKVAKYNTIIIYIIHFYFIYVEKLGQRECII